MKTIYQITLRVRWKWLAAVLGILGCDVREIPAAAWQGEIRRGGWLARYVRADRHWIIESPIGVVVTRVPTIRQARHFLVQMSFCEEE